MIEFIGSDWDKEVATQAGEMGLTDGGDVPMNKDLCDVMWEAVKVKLNG